MCGLGYRTKFPGTMGSFVAIVFSFLTYYFFDKEIYIILLLVFSILGLWSINKINKGVEQKDHSFIVIDEWIGMWIAGLFLFEINYSLLPTFSIAFLCFIVFRIIDIFKFLPPIGEIDKREVQAPTSIILDDVIAGIYTYAILMVLFGLYDLKGIYWGILVLLPAMLANMIPVLLRKINFLSAPISEKLFGTNKTWRGFLGGVILGTLLSFILIGVFLSSIEVWMLFIVFLLCLGALLGDLVKSYFKRRLGVDSGASWAPWDQIDYVLGAIILTFPFLQYSLDSMVLLILLGGTMSALAHRSAYFLKMINTKS